MSIQIIVDVAEGYTYRQAAYWARQRLADMKWAGEVHVFADGEDVSEILQREDQAKQAKEDERQRQHAAVVRATNEENAERLRKLLPSLPPTSFVTVPKEGAMLTIPASPECREVHIRVADMFDRLRGRKAEKAEFSMEWGYFRELVPTAEDVIKLWMAGPDAVPARQEAQREANLNRMKEQKRSPMRRQSA